MTATGARVAAAARREAYRRDGGCAGCGAQVGWSIQHRKKRSVGGGGGLSNLLTLCGSGTTGCHGWCETWPTRAEEMGWAVPSWADPARWPVSHHLHGWVLLDDAGLWAPV